jgi:hypothetical protein
MLQTPRSLLRLHYAFALLHVAVALAVIVSTLVLLNYEIIFQASTLGFVVLVAGIMLARMLPTDKQLSVMLVVASLASVGVLIYYMYNIVYILWVKCPPVSATSAAGEQEVLVVLSSANKFSVQRLLTHASDNSSAMASAAWTEVMRQSGQAVGHSHAWHASAQGHVAVDSLKNLLDELRARHICQQEYGLAIGVAVFLGALLLFEVATAITFSIVLQRHDETVTAKRK